MTRLKRTQVTVNHTVKVDMEEFVAWLRQKHPDIPVDVAKFKVVASHPSEDDDFNCGPGYNAKIPPPPLPTVTAVELSVRWTTFMEETEEK